METCVPLQGIAGHINGGGADIPSSSRTMLTERLSVSEDGEGVKAPGRTSPGSDLISIAPQNLNVWVYFTAIWDCSDRSRENAPSEE